MQARREDRDEDDRDLDPVRPEEGGDPADRPAAPLLRDAREVARRRGQPAAATAPPRGEAAGAAATEAHADTLDARIAATRRSRSRARRGPATLEPALGVDRGLAAVAGRGDRLAVAMVVDVAGDEDAVDLRAGLVVDHEVALLVDVEPVAEHVGVRPVADRDEQALDRQRRARSPVVGVAQPEPVDLGVAEDLRRPRCSGGPRSWGGRSARSTMIFDCPERVAPVEQVDLGREAGQEGRLLERGVAAADDRDLAVAEEEAVAGRAGARRRGRAGASRSRGRATAPTRRSRRSRTRRGTRCRAPRRGTAGSRSRPGRCRRRRSACRTARPGRGTAAISSGPWMPVREARVVLDVAGEHQLAAGRGAGEDDRLEVGPGRVDRGGQAGRARSR